MPVPLRLISLLSVMTCAGPWRRSIGAVPSCSSLLTCLWGPSASSRRPRQAVTLDLAFALRACHQVPVIVWSLAAFCFLPWLPSPWPWAVAMTWLWAVVSSFVLHSVRRV